MMQLGVEQVQVTGAVNEAQRRILSEEALRFLAKLGRTFEDRRQQLLEKRRVRQREINAGKCPIFWPTRPRFAR